MRNLTGLLEKIKPAITRETTVTENRTGDNPEFVGSVTRLNIDHSIEQIRQQSEIITQLEEDGIIKIVGGLYEVETGRVLFVDG